MKLRTIAVASAASAALLGGVVAAPADAAAATTISIHVQNAKKKGVKDIALIAGKGNQSVVVGLTNAAGNLVKSSGIDGTLSGGSWVFSLHDASEARFKAKTTYLTTTFKKKIAGGKNTSLGTKSVAASSRILGTLTAPSGRPIKGAQVLASANGKSEGIFMGASTSAKGAFDVAMLPTKAITLFAYANTDESNTSLRPTKGATVKITKAGSVIKGVAFKNVKVACQTSFTPTRSDAPGQISYSVTANGSEWGLTNPGGTVSILRDGTVVKTIPWTGISSSEGVLTGEPSDAPHRYTATYTGGDCLSWTSPATSLQAVSPMD